MKLDDIANTWNKQFDEFNQWDSLSEEEKVEFAFHLGIQMTICDFKPSFDIVDEYLNK